ncbi:hypothetical protein CARUB_v10018734mg [Capsella rubella]|uniref:F-box domain-containing protein n=1 Tax=Capsella rubella TaxID=81985 RepID=R0FRV9_9BRAS|nr:putative F-box/LRR-repeat protein 19 [Capsella rubella]EOA25402.1 hypothetical protein CARUB_v10018734mg [Capsella rubella]
MEVMEDITNAKRGSKLVQDWTELTWDCLINIFSRLSMEERWNGPMLVCKTWMNLCNDPLLNSVFDLETWFLSSTETCNRWSFEFSEQVDSMLMSVVDRSKGGLKEIRVRHCTDQSLLYVAERCPNLELLWVKHCPNVTVESLQMIALKCTKIMELDMSSSYAISPQCLEMFGKNCKNLQVVKRNYVSPSEVSMFESYENYMENFPTFIIGNVYVHAIQSSMHQLKHLEVRYLTMTDKALASICKKCPKLEYLDLFGCPKLTMDGVINSTSTLKNLKELKMPEFTA